MGVESANYQICYDGSLEQELERAVGVLGADVVSSSGRATEGVVQSDEFWIDLQIWSERPLVSVRVALCNPPGVLPMLRTILSTFAVLGRATVVDVDGDAHYEDLGARSWSGIVESFERRRAAFRDRFGDYTAAISADDVFARLRDRQASD